MMKIVNIDSYMHTFSHTETYPPHHTLHIHSLLQGVILLLLTVAQDKFFCDGCFETISYYGAQDCLQLTILLHQPFKFILYKRELPYLVSKFL